MKKILLILVFLFKSLTILGSQPIDSDSGTILIGFKGGVAFYQSLTSSAASSNYSGFGTGIQYGLTTNIPIKEKLSIQMDLLYIPKGYMEPQKGLIPVHGFDIKYMEIPVLAKMRFANAISPFINLGAGLGYALSGNATFGNLNERIDFEKFGLNRFDLSLIGGSGISFNLKKGVLIFEGRSEFSLINQYSRSPLTSRNIVYSISVGYLFPF